MKNLLPALLKARAEIPAIHKDAVNPFHNSKYATLDNIVATITPILEKHGLLIVQTFDKLDMITTLYHVSGESIESRLTLPPNEGKNPAQILGSNITYCRRYQISALVCLTVDDDMDGNQTHSKPHTATQTSLVDSLRAELSACKNKAEFDAIRQRWTAATLPDNIKKQGFVLMGAT